MTPLLSCHGGGSIGSSSGAARPGERVLEVAGGGAISEVALARIGPAAASSASTSRWRCAQGARARARIAALAGEWLRAALPLGVRPLLPGTVLGEIPDKKGAVADSASCAGGVLAVTEGSPTRLRTPVLFHRRGGGFQAAERFGNFVQFTQASSDPTASPRPVGGRRGLQPLRCCPSRSPSGDRRLAASQTHVQQAKRRSTQLD
jgi:hypothetical protein